MSEVISFALILPEILQCEYLTISAQSVDCDLCGIAIFAVLRSLQYCDLCGIEILVAEVFVVLRFLREIPFDI